MPTQIPQRGNSSPASTSPMSDKLAAVRLLFDDAPPMAKAAFDNIMRDIKPEASTTPTVSAGRIGRRQGNVSELTIIAPLAPGGAKRLRGLLEALDGNFEGANKVGTVHDMRFVMLDNDSKVLFATAFDGEWDPYIDDFATKIPDYMDILFTAFEGWPGIRSPGIKDWILKYQVPADAWYVANPDLTVVETRRLARVGKALDEFLDKISEVSD